MGIDPRGHDKVALLAPDPPGAHMGIEQHALAPVPKALIAVALAFLGKAEAQKSVKLAARPRAF
eukprot:9793810-Alexandrium_andersonii.AAC.1